jgi:hypothetical protein
MNHRRSHSESEVKMRDEDDNVLSDNVLSDAESVVSDVSSSVHTVDLYRGWRLPDLTFYVKLPGWFVLIATLLLFKGPSQPPSCVA